VAINGKVAQWIMSRLRGALRLYTSTSTVLFILNCIDEGIISEILKFTDDTKIFGK